jgi:hypothetical protein
MLANPPANYDDSWKMALEYYFTAFLEFFFPHIHADIDWSRGFVFLDQELQEIVGASEVGKRFVDKLVKVWLQDGKETWLLLNIEVQSQYDAGFAKRLFFYHYRIIDRYDQEVISLAILGDDRPNWRPQEYSYARWNCRLSLQFPIVKLLDYRPRLAELQTDPNPFAAVVIAHLQTQATTQDAERRQQFKLNLIKQLYDRSYSPESIFQLSRLVDVMMTLPDALDTAVKQEIRQFREERSMTQVIGGVERLMREEVREEISPEIKQESRREMIQALLKVKFGERSQDLFIVAETLSKLATEESAALVMTLSQAELIAQFGGSSGRNDR